MIYSHEKTLLFRDENFIKKYYNEDEMNQLEAFYVSNDRENALKLFNELKLYFED